MLSYSTGHMFQHDGVLKITSDYTSGVWKLQICQLYRCSSGIKCNIPKGWSSIGCFQLSKECAVAARSVLALSNEYNVMQCK